MRFAERRAGLLRLALIGAGALAVGIFFALLTSRANAHAAPDPRTRHAVTTHGSTHATSYIPSLASRDAAATTNSRPNAASSGAQRSTAGNVSGLARAAHAGISASSRTTAASQIAATARSGNTRTDSHIDTRAGNGAGSVNHPRTNSPAASRNHWYRQGYAATDSGAGAPASGPPPASAPVVPTKPQPASPSDDPSGPLPAPDALSLQASPTATTFGPTFPCAFLGYLALLLTAWQTRERIALRMPSGCSPSAPWPPG